jgi:hypothetical protein
VVLKCHLFEKLCFRFEGCLGNSGNNILWELGRQNNVIVECVLDKLSTAVSAMPVKNTENLYFGPICELRGLLWRLYDIQYYCDAVFVRFAHRAHVGVRCKGFHCAEGLRAHLGCLELLKVRRLFSLGSLHKFQNLLLQNRVFDLSLLFRPHDRLFDRPHYL